MGTSTVTATTSCGHWPHTCSVWLRTGCVQGFSGQTKNNNRIVLSTCSFTCWRCIPNQLRCTVATLLHHHHNKGEPKKKNTLIATARERKDAESGDKKNEERDWPYWPSKYILKANTPACIWLCLRILPDRSSLVLSRQTQRKRERERPARVC